MMSFCLMIFNTKVIVQQVCVAELAHLWSLVPLSYLDCPVTGHVCPLAVGGHRLNGWFIQAKGWVAILLCFSLGAHIGKSCGNKFPILQDRRV